ncbi:MAG TPA: hypothetical protein VM934_18025 [Pyrinomonadaceae bacterium]|nr:hypothetical protein [Pyrinomonadaceae bacterium]
MRRFLTRAARAVLFSLIFTQAAFAQQAAAPEHDTDIGAFAKEVMILKMEGGQAQLAMWMPFEFFVDAAAAQSGKPRSAIESDIAFLKPYITIAVQHSLDKPDGSSLYATEAEIRSRAVLRLDDGTEIAPLTTVPPLVSVTLSALKTFIAADGGAGNANLHLLIFPNKTAQGKPVVSTTQKDKLTLTLKNHKTFRAASFTWRTPFDAATHTPDCPKCKSAMSAKWSYCPYDGQKLP